MTDHGHLWLLEAISRFRNLWKVDKKNSEGKKKSWQTELWMKNRELSIDQEEVMFPLSLVIHFDRVENKINKVNKGKWSLDVRER